MTDKAKRYTRSGTTDGHAWTVTIERPERYAICGIVVDTSVGQIPISYTRGSFDTEQDLLAKVEQVVRELAASRN